MDTHIQKLGKFALACILAISMSLPINAFGNKANAAENNSANAGSTVKAEQQDTIHDNSKAAESAQSDVAADTNISTTNEENVAKLNDGQATDNLKVEDANSQNELAVETTNSTEAVTLTESGNIADWTACGTCEWMIDADGNMTIRPANGASEGTLDSWGYSSSDESPWADFKSGIKTVTVKNKVYASPSCSWLFSFCKNLTSVDLSGLDTSNVTDMRYMFDGCSSLTSLDLSNFDTSKVTSMDWMFYGCSSLTSLDLSNFDTSNVTYMGCMFYGCSSLTNLDLSNFDTSNVTYMGNMFYDCSSLTNLDLSNFDTSKATSMGYMFYGCYFLSTIQLGDKFSFCGAGTERLCNFPRYNWKNSEGKSFKSDAIPNNTKDTYTYDENADIVSWTACGTCEWMIDGSGNMTIRPANGAAEGTLDDWHKNSSWDGSTPWKDFKSTIKTAKVENKVYAQTCYDFFSSCTSLTSVDLSGLDTSNVTDMRTMFERCSSLTSLDLSNFDTSKVTDMSIMFDGCSSLTNLDLSNFDTSKVTDMGNMFHDCSSLTNLDLSNFDTSKATSMVYMFYGCYFLSTIQLGDKFSFCGAGTERLCNFPRYNWKNSEGKSFKSDAIPNNTKDTYTYDENADIVSWTACGTCEWMIDKDGNMTIRPANGASEGTLEEGTPWSNKDEIKTVTVKNKVYASPSCYGLFSDLENLTSVDLSGLDTSKVTYMQSMFSGCSSLTTLNLSKFDTSNVTNMRGMFYGCSSLTSLDLSNFDTSKVTDMYHMFYRCSSLTSLDLSNFDTSKVTSMYYMFSGCSSLTTLNLSKFDTSNVTIMSYMFSGCSSLTSLDLSKFDTSKVTGMEKMFSGCSSLTNLDLSNFDTSKATSMGDMFSGCSSLTNLDLSNFNTSKLTDMYHMFYRCSSLTSLDLSNFDTSKVTYMGDMFSGCSSLTSLNLSKFDTSNVTNMQRMFSGCSLLTSLDLSNFDTSKVAEEYYYDVFKYCSSLTSVKLGSKFSFNGASETRQCSLPDGNWVNSAGKVFAASEVPNNVADTYTKEGFSALDFTKFTVNTTDAVYTGSPIVGRVSSSSYTEGTDYTAAYANNTEVGKATITITGVGSYTGSKTYEFTIAKEGTLAGEASADTAAAIAKEAFPEGVSSGWVVIARDDDFADAMSATGLAGALDAPILLTNRNELSSVTAQTVKDLGATQAYIIGGTGAIPGDLESALKTQANCTVKARVFGTDAWDTSVECAKRIKEHGGNKTSEAIVAMGTNFQDALSISSFAYKYALPLFLETDANNGRCLTADAKAAVRDAIGSTGTIYVPGGTGAVPEASVEGEFSGSKIVRLEGYNGYDTSNQIATWMVKNNKLDASTICVANGSEAPKGTDALAGAALAGKRGGVMLLTNSVSSFGDTSRTTIDGTDSKNTPAFIKTNAASVKSAYMLGGSAVMPDDLKQSIATILG